MQLNRKAEDRRDREQHKYGTAGLALKKTRLPEKPPSANAPSMLLTLSRQRSTDDKGSNELAMEAREAAEEMNSSGSSFDKYANSTQWSIKDPHRQGRKIATPTPLPVVPANAKSHDMDTWEEEPSPAPGFSPVHLIAPRISAKTLDKQRMQSTRQREIEAEVFAERKLEAARQETTQRLQALGAHAISGFRELRRIEVERLAGGLSEFALQQLSDLLDPLNLSNSRRQDVVPPGQDISSVVYQFEHFKTRNTRGEEVKLAEVESLANLHPYEVLNISPSTSFEKIREAKERLQVLLDPLVLLLDSANGAPESSVCAAHMLVHAAFEVIRDEYSGKKSGNATAVLTHLKNVD